MPEVKKYPELEYMQWRALVLVNENCLLSASKCSHILYGHQGGRARATQLLDALWELGLVINMGCYYQFRYMTTPKGDDYIENAIKPAPPMK